MVNPEKPRGEPLGPAQDHPLAQDVNWLFHRVALGFGEARARVVGEFGLTVREDVLLTVLSRLSGMTQHELASLIGLDKSVFTSTVDSLERKGLVRRRTDQRDRRARRPELTPAGRRLSEQSSRAVEQLRNDLLASLAPETADELIQTLHAFVFGPFSDAVSFGSHPPQQREVTGRTGDATQ